MNRLHRAMVLVALCAAPVFPCGGPGSYPIDAPLVTIDRTLQAVESGQDDYESRRRVELRFLAPFRGSPGVNDALWAYAYPDAVWNALPGYDSSASFVLPDSAPLLAALRRGDGAAASAAARTIVDRALGLPAGVADAYAGLTNRALEWLDDAPRLTSTPRAALLTTFWRDSAPPAGVLPLRDLYAARHIARDSIATWLTAHPASPYAAALEFAAIKRAMQTQIPNGWANEVRDSVPATTWRALRQLHQDWLGAHAADARAPWVRFSRARLAYFAGDTAQTWEPWLALYATGTHRPRVLSEMRYLVMQGMLPPEDARTDVALQAALLTERRLTVAQWNRAWDATAGAVPAVRLTTQERLLWHVAHRPLADSMVRLTSFPRLPAVPSSLWGEMRGVALARAGRRVAALEQLRLLPTDTLVAPLRAQLLLGERRWADAVRAPALPFEARQYLLRVMAPDSVLVDIAGGSDRRLAAEARLVQATRRGAAGQWTAAIAALPPGQSKRVALWTTARSLSSDTTAAGTLARARWLRQRNGALYFGSDKIWYRSLNWRLAALQSGDSAYGFSAALPWTAAAETEAIGRHLRGTYEMYHSVVAYRDWLQRPGLLAVERRRVAREADAVYRWLVDWDNNNSSFWKDTLEAEGIGRAIRDAGRR